MRWFDTYRPKVFENEEIRKHLKTDKQTLCIFSKQLLSALSKLKT